MSQSLYFEGLEYISSRRAAEIAKYSRDYVGQLARQGVFRAKLIGRVWYVSKDDILKHSFTYDSNHSKYSNVKDFDQDKKTFSESKEKNIDESVDGEQVVNVIQDSTIVPSSSPAVEVANSNELETRVVVSDEVVDSPQDSKYVHNLVSSFIDKRSITQGAKLSPKITSKYESDNRPLLPSLMSRDTAHNKPISDGNISAKSFNVDTSNNGDIISEIIQKRKRIWREKLQTVLTKKRGLVLSDNLKSQMVMLSVSLAIIGTVLAAGFVSPNLKTIGGKMRGEFSYFGNLVSNAYLSLTEKSIEQNSNDVLSFIRERIDYGINDIDKDLQIKKQDLQNIKLLAYDYSSGVSDSLVDNSKNYVASIGSVFNNSLVWAKNKVHDTICYFVECGASTVLVNRTANILDQGTTTIINNLVGGVRPENNSLALLSNDVKDIYALIANISSKQEQAGIFNRSQSDRNMDSVGTALGNVYTNLNSIIDQRLANISGSISGSGIFSGNVSIGGQISISGLATSTVNGDVNFDSNTLYIDSLNNRVGVSTSSPLSSLDIFGDVTLSGANRYMNFGDISGTTGYGIRDNAGTIEFKNLAGSWIGIGSGSGGGGGGSDSNWSYFNGSGIRLATTSNTVLIGANSTTTSSKLEVIGAGYFSSSLGIGTTSPWARLSVAGSAGQTTPIFALSTSTSGFATSTAFVIDSNGKVGIGTTTPYTELSVQGGVAGRYFNADSSTATSTFAGGLNVAGTSGLTVLQNGNIGIGTSSPSSKLFLAGGNFVHTASGNPTLTGTYNTSGNAYGVHVSGKYAYVADGNSGLQIIDISNSASPTLTGTYDTSDFAPGGIYVSGNYAYLSADSAGLRIIDISNSANPTLAGTYDTSGTAYGVYVSGKYAYVADWSSGLQIIDISNPTSPTLTGTYDTSGNAYRVYVSGKYAYVADWSSGLQIIDISNPASPTLTGTYNTSGTAYGVYVSGKYAYIADGDSGLQIIDISNPASPTLTGTYNTTSTSEDVYVSGKYAYVADWSSGLQIIDISNPANPTLTGTYNTSGTAYGVYVSGKYAYVADESAGLRIIDINGIETPSLYAGNIATNALTVTENTYVGNNLYAKNGLNVGMGGIFTDGALSVAGTLSSYFGGNLGLGTTSPYAKLSVTNTSTTQPALALYGFNSQTSPLMLVASTTGTATSTAFIIDSNGKVGIGTTTPYTELSVQGGIAGQYFNADSSTATSTLKGGLNVAGTPGLTVLQNGYVGVGTVNPSTKLHVSDGNSVNSSIITGTAPSFLASAQGQNLLSAVLVSANSASFRPIFSGYRSRGTVGSPTAVVNGDILFSFLANGYDGSSSQAPAQINFTVDGTVSSGHVPASVSFVTGTNDSDRTARLTISSGGNIGIGTTSPYAKLSVTGSAGQTTPIFALSTSTSGFATSTAFVIDSNGKVGIGTTTPYTELSVQGGIAGQYFNADSTTSTSTFAGGLIVGGYLGLGTTTPSARLHVAGTGANDIGRFDYGIDLNPVTNTTSASISLVAEAGSVDAGVHYYYTSFYTVLGETELKATSPTSVTTDGSNGKVLVTLPISTDYRVVGRRIYRSTAGSTFYTNVKLVASIADNVSTTYTDNIADSALTGTNYYFKDNNTSKYLTVNGTQAMILSSLNTVFGKNAGATISAGTAQASENTLIGSNSGTSITTGSFLTAVGAGALRLVTSGNDNTALGNSALYHITTGNSNVGIGRNTGSNNQTGHQNVLIGVSAGVGTSGNSYSGNALIGYQAGYLITTGGYNTMMGYNVANGGIKSGSYNIAIGVGASPLSPTGSQQLNIGNVLFGTNIYGSTATSSAAVVGAKLGISTTTPWAKLSIAGDANGTMPLFTISSSTASATSTAFIIDSNGKVGIGTTSPSQELSVSGNGYFTGSLIANSITGTNFNLGSGLANMLAGFDASGNLVSTSSPQVAYLNATSTTATSTFAGGLNVAGTSGLTIFQNGLVGIGTSSPQGLLDLSGSSNSTDLTTFIGSRSLSIINTNTTNNNANGLAFRTMDANGLITTGAKFDAVYTSHTANAVSADLAFLTRNAGTISEKMRILSSGNVGIGTTSPYAKLSVTNTSTTQPALALYGFNSQTSPLMLVASTTGTATSTAFIIDSNGKVGIGTTTPYTELSVQGGIAGRYFNADSTTSTSTFAGIVNVNGSLILKQGLSNNLSLSFINDQDSGLYSAGDGLVDMVINNIRSMEWGPSYLTFAENNIKMLHTSNYDTIQTYSSGFQDRIVMKTDGNVGIATTSPYAKFSITGSAGQTTPIFALSTSTSGFATSTAFVIDSNGKVGIGTTTPSQELSVAGNALFGVGSSSYLNFNAGLFNYLQAATTTIKDNQPYAWTIATSSTALPLISIQTITGQMATTSIYSNLNVGSGSLLYDYSSGLSSINGLQMSGTLSFDTDAGVVAWTDLPVSAAVAGTPQSYSAQIGGNDILTIYGESAGSGLVQNMRVGIGSTTPFATLSVTGTTSSATSWAFAVADVSSTTRFMVRDDGYVGIGTTSPAATLGINGNIFVGGAGTSTVQNNLNVLGTLHGQVLYSGDLFFANNFSFTEAPLNGTTQGLLLRNQNGQDALTIDDEGNLSLAGDVCYKGKQCFGKSLTSLEEYVNVLASSTAESLFSSQATTTRNLNELTISVDNINQSLTAINSRIDSLASTTLEYFASSTLSNALASSTADILASSSPSFIARISNSVIEYIQSSATWVFTKISSALAIFDRVETKTAAVSNGLEMTDQNTNEIYCVQIKNGEFAKSKGACSQNSSASSTSLVSTSSVPISSPIIPTEIVVPTNTSPIPSIISTPVSTTTDTVVSTTTTQSVDMIATSSPAESQTTSQSGSNVNTEQNNSSNVTPVNVPVNEAPVVPVQNPGPVDAVVSEPTNNSNAGSQQPVNSGSAQSPSVGDSTSAQSGTIMNTTSEPAVNSNGN